MTCLRRSGDTDSEIQRLHERLRKLEERPATPGVKEGKGSELTWAKATACDFLDALKNNQYKLALSLTGPEFTSSFFGADEFLSRAVQRVNQGHEITEEQLSPSREEARFKGVSRGEVFNEKTENQFTVRLTKVKGGEQWRVSYFVHEPPPKKEELKK